MLRCTLAAGVKIHLIHGHPQNGIHSLYLWKLIKSIRAVT